jgi:hypothetical protein
MVLAGKIHLFFSGRCVHPKVFLILRDILALEIATKLIENWT